MKTDYIKNEYMKLYEDCLNSGTFFNDAHFVAIRGEKYNLDSKIRFMLIGRAPNGWMQINTKTKEIFGIEANLQYQDVKRWNWIKEINGKLYSVNDENGKKYSLNRSAFWSYSREVFKCLSNQVEGDKVWQKNIVWSNLYKVAPLDGGNPCSKSQKVQLNASKEILKKELNEFNPTHILIMSGFEFFKPFSELFDEVKDNGKRNKSSKKDFVEGTAKYKKAKVVIACRPEGRIRDGENGYVAEVLKAFDK